MVQFFHAKDKAKVLAGCPWTFDQNLVLLNDFEGNQQPSNITMNLRPFWIRSYNLPLGCRSAQHIRLLAGSIREVLEMDGEGVSWDTSAHFRVHINVTKPLRRVQRISMGKGESALIEVKYERLPTFCYACGVMGDIEQDFLSVNDEEKAYRWRNNGVLGFERILGVVDKNWRMKRSNSLAVPRVSNLLLLKEGVFRVMIFLVLLQLTVMA